jgi:hypothetical protein
MASNPRGVPSIVNSLIRPSAPNIPTPPETDEGQGADSGDSTTSAVETKPRTSRRRKALASEVSKGRKISLPDSVFERLELTAIKRKTTISAVATDILDRNLPRLRIESD